MKDAFVEYLKEIGMTDILVNRVKQIYDFYHEVCPEEITAIFVNEFIKEDGKRQYDNAWFFTDKYVMEAKQFIVKDQFDMTLLRKRVVYWAVEKQDYDFKVPTEKSRLLIRMEMDTGIAGEFKASKENCDRLRDLFVQYISSNLKD